MRKNEVNLSQETMDALASTVATAVTSALAEILQPKSTVSAPKTSGKKSSTKSAQTSSKKSEKEPVKVLGVEIEKFRPCKDKDGYYLWQGFRGYKYQRSEFCYAVQGLKRDSHKGCDYDKKWNQAKAAYEKHFGAYVPKDER